MLALMLCLGLSHGAAPDEMAATKLVIGDTTITLPKATAAKINGVKTPNGPRVRVVANGVTIEAPLIVVYTQSRKITHTATEAGFMNVVSEPLPDGGP